MSKFVSPEDIEAVFERQQMYHKREKMTAKKKDLIRRRFLEGYTIPDLVKAIDGCHLSPFNCGKNDTQTKFLELKYSLNQDSICKFIEVAEDDLKRKQMKELTKNTRENQLHFKKGEPRITEEEMAEFRRWRKEAGV